MNAARYQKKQRARWARFQEAVERVDRYKAIAAGVMQRDQEAGYYVSFQEFKKMAEKYYGAKEAARRAGRKISQMKRGRGKDTIVA